MGLRLVQNRRRGSASALETDARLFEALKDCLPPDGVIAFLHEHHMSAPFKPEELSGLREFCSSWQSSDRAFRDRRLEKLRRLLLRRCADYLGSVRELTHLGPDGLVSVPRVWHEEEPGKFDMAVYRLNRLAARIVHIYGQLTRAAHGRLGVAGQTSRTGVA